MLMTPVRPLPRKLVKLHIGGPAIVTNEFTKITSRFYSVVNPGTRNPRSRTAVSSGKRNSKNRYRLSTRITRLNPIIKSNSESNISACTSSDNDPNGVVMVEQSM